MEKRVTGGSIASTGAPRWQNTSYMGGTAAPSKAVSACLRGYVAEGETRAGPEGLVLHD